MPRRLPLWQPRSQEAAPAMSQSEQDVKQPAGASFGASFDVHGVVGIDAATPGESQLRDMLAPFLGESRAPRRITIGGNVSPVSAQSHAEDAYRFTADSLYIPTDRVQITETPDGYRVEGAGELLTAVIPLLDRLCVLGETAMIHAAVVDFRGSGVLLPAWGGVGKTSTVAKLVAMRDGRFVADDWAFMGAGGILMGYAKPMFIKAHHRAIYPDLFRGTRKPLAPGWLINPVAHLAWPSTPRLCVIQRPQPSRGAGPPNTGWCNRTRSSERSGSRRRRRRSWRSSWNAMTGPMPGWKRAARSG
jgi:hypothetical protein